jgi:hypothetical protein
LNNKIEKKPTKIQKNNAKIISIIHKIIKNTKLNKNNDKKTKIMQKKKQDKKDKKE